MRPNSRVVRERWSGTRGGRYVYVAEGDHLVHVSRYAIRSEHGGNWVIHEVPESRLAGKVLYYFWFSNSGSLSVAKCRIEGFSGEGFPRELEWLEGYDELQNKEFCTQSPTLRQLQKQFWQLIVPIIEDVKNYTKERNFEIYFLGMQGE